MNHIKRFNERKLISRDFSKEKQLTNQKVKEKLLGPVNEKIEKIKKRLESLDYLKIT